MNTQICLAFGLCYNEPGLSETQYEELNMNSSLDK